MFRTRYSERCLLVFNERVLAEPHQECARIFDFLGVENEPGPAQALQRTSGFSSFEFVSSAQKEAAREAWTSWSRDQRRIFTREAGDTIVALGYLTADELDRVDADAPDACEALSRGHARVVLGSTRSCPDQSRSRARRPRSDFAKVVIAPPGNALADLLLIGEADAEFARTLTHDGCVGSALAVVAVARVAAGAQSIQC